MLGAVQLDLLEDVMDKYVRAYLTEPLERVGAIRDGVEQAELVALAADLNISVQSLRKALRVKGGAYRCSADASERILGLMALIGQVDTMVHRHNPDAKFGAAAWLGNWLNNPVGALGGIRPASLLDTMAGMAILSNLLALSGSGAFA
ncbi:antitoxin Xre/MbcA/ParS toxin-binding domain-containing protein [Massilia aquatica]|nr:antitoxin Xre/MbcA/ParS toxin-binding domain-containing protein [Massilia aquatica]